ncbi:MAG: amidohydrolase [Treponema sp.]|jgi:predicted amidohydrolase YtcJ|nr:amidohydrolase [Treponema sp.]
MLTLFHNVTVYREREKFDQAALIEGDVIRGTGTDAEMTALAASLGKVEKIDGRGGLLLPGFHDSHLHLRHFGSAVHDIDVRKVSSIDELVEKGRADLERIAAEPGVVVHGGGWNQEDFLDKAGEAPSGKYPTRFDLDRITTDRALILERICGHTLCCNTKALEMAEAAGLGELLAGDNALRDGAGKPLGVFFEKAAIALSQTLVSPLTDAQARSQVEYGIRCALAFGITSIDTNDVFDDNWEQITGAYRSLLKEGKHRIRVGLQCYLTRKPILDEFCRRRWLTGETLGHPLLKMGALKLFADGTLGSRTAWLESPYTDDPGNRGLQAMDGPAMEAAVKDGDDRGFQVIAHAIGDAAADQVLRSLEAVTSRGHNPRRHGIVHCEVMNEDLLDRMARNGVTAFVQPAFLTHDIFFAESRLGRERARCFLPCASLILRGIPTGFGTDCPVESLDPLQGIAWAVLRRPMVLERDAGSLSAEGFFPEERVDIYTAVDAYTLGSARITGEEGRKGRIQPGYLADLVLLDRNIFAVPADEIPQAKVMLTMVGGEIAFSC